MGYGKLLNYKDVHEHLCGEKDVFLPPCAQLVGKSGCSYTYQACVVATWRLELWGDNIIVNFCVFK